MSHLESLGDDRGRHQLAGGDLFEERVVRGLLEKHAVVQLIANLALGPLLRSHRGKNKRVTTNAAATKCGPHRKREREKEKERHEDKKKKVLLAFFLALLLDMAALSFCSFVFWIFGGYTGETRERGRGRGREKEREREIRWK